jgi:cell fate regulator YaaT (PSP1 superfamily)
MATIVEVTFKGNRREYYVAEQDVSISDYVIVEADRGEDLGRVTAAGAVAERKCSGCSTGCSAPVPERRVLRRARPEEVASAVQLREDEPRVRRITREKVLQYGLKMKVSEAEWQHDRNKLTIYFTAERRVDFRELVRDLARTFRTRIELKQIGVRDEAALLGGVGRCGRELCCSSSSPSACSSPRTSDSRSTRHRSPAAAGASCAASPTSTTRTSQPASGSRARDARCRRRSDARR